MPSVKKAEEEEEAVIDTAATAKDLDGEGRIIQPQHKEEEEEEEKRGMHKQQVNKMLQIGQIAADITSPRKKLKLFNNHQEEDRISNLPDSVVCHILSRLQTRDAVATSVLSRNWRYKWTSIYDIDLDTLHLSLLPRIGRKPSIRSFHSFMNRLLLSSDPWRIRCFRLSSAWRYRRDIEKWAAAVLRRGVQNLYIETLSVDTSSSRCFSGWESLTELKLYVRCTLGVSARNCLSRLKSLCLMDVRIENEESQNTTSRHVLLSFPVLEVLELKYCKWMNVDHVEINAPKLIKFTSQVFSDFFDKLHLNAPAVTHAYLDHHKSDTLAPWAYRIVNGFQNLRCLTVSSETAQALSEMISMLDFSTRTKLKELEILKGYLTGGKLMEFLHVFPSLESISLGISSSWNGGRDLEPLPRCIGSNLKKFRFANYDGRISIFVLALAESILKNAKNLEMVILSAGCNEAKKILQHQFSKLLPQGSTCDLQMEDYVEFWDTFDWAPSTHLYF